MMGIGRIRAAASRLLVRKVQGEAPVSARPADPIPGALGPGAFRWNGRPPQPLPTVPARWDLDAERGTPLPTGPNVPADSVPDSSREAHRLGWFAALAEAHAAGHPHAAAAAVTGLEAWLRHDVPGHGIAWVHPTDISVRLVNLAAGLSWLGAAAPPRLVAAAAGSADWHLRHLSARMPTGAGHAHRRVAHHVGLFVGALTFPSVPGARATWAEAASALGPAAAELGCADGSDPSHAPLFLEQSLWLLTVAIAVGRANGVALPAAATAAWARGVRYLDRLALETGSLPPIGEAPFGTVLPEAHWPLAWSMRTLALAWQLDDGEPPPGHTLCPRAGWFGAAAPRGDTPAPATALPAGKNAWSMWSYAATGTVVAGMRARNEPFRVVVCAQTGGGGPFAHAAALTVAVDVGPAPLLVDPGPGHPNPAEHNGLTVAGTSAETATLKVARVDGKKARIEGSAALSRHQRWARDVLLNQQRVLITDRLEGRGGPVRLRFALGAGWVREGEGRTFTLRNGGRNVGVVLAEGLRWQLHEGELLGEGELAAGAEITNSFELK